MTIKDILMEILQSFLTCHCDDEDVESFRCAWCLNSEMHRISMDILMESGEYH